MSTQSSIVGIAIVAALCLSFGVHAQQRAIEFNRDIRPILSENCFLCHGPDKQRSGLRLDQRDVALEKKAIVPNAPEASELVRRITSDDPEERMPLAESNRSLTQQQIDTLTRWIAEGAEYQPHWAFEPVRKPEIPRTDAAWPRNDIDAFVLDRLKREGLTPRDAADKSRLLRRVTFDLTGLPPTVEELHAFLADDAPGAYERVVDRLLASPRYGEHMAVGWLDLARYADTYGYQNDRPSHLWPWRDWVIRAFNENLPYDDFITWQLAGDLLPKATQDQRLATAFNRLHRQTNEGGSINEELLVEYAVDRTDTFGTAFLGLTLACARCHDHKFDPISQREYFSVFAFFSNIDESGMYSHFTDATPTPNMFLYETGQADRHAELRAAVVLAERALDEAQTHAASRYDDWIAAGPHIAEAKPVVRLQFESVQDGKTPNDAAQDVPATIAPDVAVVPGRNGNGIHLSGENTVTIAVGDFERTDPFSISAWLKLGENSKESMVIWHRSVAASDAGSRGYELIIDRGRLAASLVHFWPGNAIRVQSEQTIHKNEWVHVAMTYDGSSRASGLRLYVGGAPEFTEVVRDGLYNTIKYESGNQPPITIGARFRDAGFKDGYVDDFQVFDYCLTPPEIAAIAGADSPKSDAGSRRTYYFEHVDTEVAEARDRLRESRDAESLFAESLRQIMVMLERETPPVAHVLARGAYDAPRDEVTPDVPVSVLAFPADLPRNRLGLAQWLVARENPLTARVAVNRLWEHFFGSGLVSTMADFGSQGALPSHPELLDYLAVSFVESGWDVKRFCRELVTSATYMQESTPDPALLDRDPQNTLLARGPRNRLSAEETRDAALAASGLLTPAIGGPSVNPYQPAGLWEEAGNTTFTPDTGDKLYRRSLYTFIKRTVPPPMMMTFDATNREMCVARREVTETPLQALVLLNDPQFVEPARVLAARTMELHGDVGLAIQEAFERLVGREPRHDELSMLGQAFAEQREFFASDAEGAAAYTLTGEFAANDTINAVDLAAMTAVVQLLMNYDEFQVKS